MTQWSPGVAVMECTCVFGLSTEYDPPPNYLLWAELSLIPSSYCELSARV